MNKIVHLTKIDIDVISFSNGQEAIDNFQSSLLNNKQLPNIILLDIEMPHMDGWDFMNHIELLMKKHALSDIKIYIVSSSISHDDVEKAESNNNILGYYSKPIKSEDIAEIIMRN
jgi:CheY-like chemotaxis protein